MVKGTPKELKRIPEVSPEGTRRISVANDSPPLALRALKSLPFVRDATLVEAEIHLLIDKDTEDEEIGKAMRGANLPDFEIRPIDPSLEDVFVTLTRKLEKR
jgi:hypothetical protein